MSGVVTFGLDLAKSIFQIHGVDDAGRTMLRRRLSRHELVSYFAKLPMCVVGLEACSAAHHGARELSRLGHLVRLIPPQYVKLCEAEQDRCRRCRSNLRSRHQT